MIRRAKILEIPDILSITKACDTHMRARGIMQWNENYPNKLSFEEDIARHELYVLDELDKLVGLIAISAKKDAEYDLVEWLTPDGGNLYIHRLAVHPEYQGRGYARRLMDFAESKARDSGATSIRLDTFSRNSRNQKFYEQRGYQRLGDIFLPAQSPYPFHCYELVL